MLKYVFSGLGIIMIVVMLITWLIVGELPDKTMHLAAYGFILAGLGYIIEALKKKEQTSADHLKYVLDKNQKETVEEIRTIRTMVFKMQERINKYEEHE
jgi:uncharacterized protein YlxW (UPF0749 family)